MQTDLVLMLTCSLAWANKLCIWLISLQFSSLPTTTTFVRPSSETTSLRISTNCKQEPIQHELRGLLLGRDCWRPFFSSSGGLVTLAPREPLLLHLPATGLAGWLVGWLIGPAQHKDRCSNRQLGGPASELG